MTDHIVRFTDNGQAIIRTGKGMYVMRKFQIKVKRSTHYRVNQLGRQHKVSVLKRLLVGVAEWYDDKLFKAMQQKMTVVLETLTLDGVLNVVRKLIKTVMPDWLVIRFKLGRCVDLAFGAGLA